MQTLQILIVGLLTLFYSCGKSDISKIEFDGQTFELPIKVEIAKEELGLQYGFYSGFFNGNVNDKTIETQFENYPLFMGSDNDKEQSYYKKYFVGITFFRQNKSLEQFRNEFEKQYKKNLRQE